MERESGRSQEQSQEEKTAGKFSDSFPRTKVMNGYSCEVSALSTRVVEQCRKLQTLSEVWSNIVSSKAVFTVIHTLLVILAVMKQLL